MQQKRIVGNVTLNHHTEYLTLADTDDSDKTLVVHVTDIPKLLKELKHIQRKMAHDTAKRKANGG